MDLKPKYCEAMTWWLRKPWTKMIMIEISICKKNTKNATRIRKNEKLQYWALSYHVLSWPKGRLEPKFHEASFGGWGKYVQTNRQTTFIYYIITHYYILLHIQFVWLNSQFDSGQLVSPAGVEVGMGKSVGVDTEMGKPASPQQGEHIQRLVQSFQQVWRDKAV